MEKWVGMDNWGRVELDRDMLSLPEDDIEEGRPLLLPLFPLRPFEVWATGIGVVSISSESESDSLELELESLPLSLSDESDSTPTIAVASC